MKRITVLTLTLLILLIGSLNVSPIHASSSNIGPLNDMRTMNSPGLDQSSSAGSYYPIFMNVTSSAGTTEIRERNNTLGEGAIVQFQEKTNVTFYYAVALQNSTDFVESNVDFRLFADLPNVNETSFNNTGFSPELSLSEIENTLSLTYTNTNTTNHFNYTLPDGSIVDNATLYYFSNSESINASVNYIPFYVEDLTNTTLSESVNNGAHNLLTTEEYTSVVSQDDFYIQNEIVNITGSLFFDDTGDSNDIDLGIFYDVNADGTGSEFNFTLVYDGVNATANLTFTDYSIGTEIAFSSIMFIGNDTLTNTSRVIEKIDSKVVDVGDGTPELEVEILSNDQYGFTDGNTTYSTNFSITFIIETTVPKGNITDLFLLASDDDTNPKSFDKINDSFSIAPINQTIDYSVFSESTDGGQFNTTIVTETDKGITVNTTFIVIIDKIAPIIGSLEVTGSNPVVTQDGSITFNFGFGDDNSGIRMAILDFGDNSSMEVTDLFTVTHKYDRFSDNTYEYTLTIFDYAGNNATSTGILQVTSTPLESTGVSSLTFWIFLIVLLATITSWWWGPKIVSFINERR